MQRTTERRRKKKQGKAYKSNIEAAFMTCQWLTKIDSCAFQATTNLKPNQIYTLEMYIKTKSNKLILRIQSLWFDSNLIKRLSQKWRADRCCASRTVQIVHRWVHLCVCVREKKKKKWWHLFLTWECCRYSIEWQTASLKWKINNVTDNNRSRHFQCLTKYTRKYLHLLPMKSNLK